MSEITPHPFVHAKSLQMGRCVGALGVQKGLAAWYGLQETIKKKAHHVSRLQRRYSMLEERKGNHLAEMRRVAEAATPGPWRKGDGSPATSIVVYPAAPSNLDIFTGSDQDAAHIATFDPPTVLALLDVVEACDDDGRCRLCWNERGDPHADDCPIARLNEIGGKG